MNIDEITKQLEIASREAVMRAQSTTGWVEYISDRGKNSCPACLANHGRKFRIDDPALPEIPVHPHCRCHYEETTSPAVLAANTPPR